VTASKLIRSYLYRGGEWEDLGDGHSSDPEKRNALIADATVHSHDEDVTFRAYTHDGQGSMTVRVPGHSSESNIFSVAHKWGYAHAAIYGNPRSGFVGPYIAVMEISEDGFEGMYEHLSPYPYMVVMRLVFDTTVVFADSTPDLVRLLNELLPLITSKPQNTAISHLYEGEHGSGPYVP